VQAMTIDWILNIKKNKENTENTEI
jgi:hypothetical protein